MSAWDFVVDHAANGGRQELIVVELEVVGFGKSSIIGMMFSSVTAASAPVTAGGTAQPFGGPICLHLQAREIADEIDRRVGRIDADGEAVSTAEHVGRVAGAAFDHREGEEAEICAHCRGVFHQAVEVFGSQWPMSCIAVWPLAKSESESG